VISASNKKKQFAKKQIVFEQDLLGQCESVFVLNMFLQLFFLQNLGRHFKNM
jgi:hypothetical protein